MVPVLDKAIRLLELLASRPEGCQVRELVEGLGIPQATAYRMLHTLAAAGWVRQREDRAYELSLGLLPIARALQPWEALIEAARQPMTRLVNEVELTAKLSVRQGHEHVTLLRVESPREMAATTRVGARYPLAVGATGGALLRDSSAAERRRLLAAVPEDLGQQRDASHLEERVAACRSTGACFNRTDHPGNVHTVAAPVLGAAGQVVAAITLIGLAGELSDAALPLLRDKLLAAAAACAAQLPSEGVPQ